MKKIFQYHAVKKRVNEKNNIFNFAYDADMKSSVNRLLLALSHYDRDRQMEPHIFHQLVVWAQHCREIRFISNSLTPAVDAKRRKGIVTVHRERPNPGYDFEFHKPSR